jgi:predicted house-cleaning noncanonical NTP pyrophosphatase (MazG superfamily)
VNGYVEDCDNLEDASLEEAEILLDVINRLAAELDDNEYENMFEKCSY